MSELQADHVMTPEQWTWLLCSVSAILANKLSLQEFHQLIGIKLLTFAFLQIFSPWSQFPLGGKCPFCPLPCGRPCTGVISVAATVEGQEGNEKKWTNHFRVTQNAFYRLHGRWGKIAFVFCFCSAATLCYIWDGARGISAVYHRTAASRDLICL